jgi:hypothetical protein
MMREQRRLDYSGTYICPVCRHGEIAALTLMEAFSCNFCRHIFTANLSDQLVQVEDSSQPMTWRWTGRTWQAANQSDRDLTLLVWLVGLALVLLPSGLIWLSAHTFPPLPGSDWAKFPLVWMGITFSLHFLLVAWLLVEYYQLPLYVMAKVRWQQWRRRS